ncbi:hypothetical protein Misp01_41040 [Microtetraspora sp. NBRC 13810]|uniref:hypothetical protein n=1 Tax=Microtetraspora sp. NBRC 13810 TaxID=3030990 RepID=UPI0025563783|nr:hypothetical protein [Microtetraspora sp. NBRC 13810]GLW08974.1 hypothetical protein Misp01_41040 [Microtetraspora sp. NBRC 13810]
MTDADVADLFRDDPMAQPLTYPGRIPATSGVLVDDAYLALCPVESAPADEWQVGDETLEKLLARLGCAPMVERHPVVAVGSNASPSQMRRKFVTHGIRPVIPMTLADVEGIAPGVSAHVNRWGYVPAVPVETPGESSRLFVLWLDDRELSTLDITEPNYWRRRMPVERHPVALESGVLLPPCYVYVGKHGCLADETGEARRLTDQRRLIQSLLDESAELRRLCGSTPDEFISLVRDEALRDTIYRLFPAERRTLLQPGLVDLPSS